MTPHNHIFPAAGPAQSSPLTMTRMPRLHQRTSVGFPDNRFGKSATHLSLFPPTPLILQARNFGPPRALYTVNGTAVPTRYFMFGVNWNDPQTLWLNYTNLGLGLVVVACIAVVAYGFALEIVARTRKATSPDVDHQVRELFANMEGSHTFSSPELGLTMADGGEPEKPQSPKDRK